MENYIKLATSTEAPSSVDLLLRLQKQDRSIHAIMGLTTEIGELTDNFKKHIFYGAELDLTNIDEELGDILWYLAILMDEWDIDFTKCMEANIRKLKSRYPDKFNKDDALERDTECELEAMRDVKFNHEREYQ